MNTKIFQEKKQTLIDQDFLLNVENAILKNSDHKTAKRMVKTIKSELTKSIRKQNPNFQQTII